MTVYNKKMNIKYSTENIQIICTLKHPIINLNKKNGIIFSW